MSRSVDISAAFNGVAVTTSDATIIPATRALYIGGTGNVAVKHSGGTTVTYNAVAVGVFPVQVTQVLATGTTATNIVAMY